MKRPFLWFFVVFSLACPSPVSALRPSPVDQPGNPILSGLEEALTGKKKEGPVTRRVRKEIRIDWERLADPPDELKHVRFELDGRLENSLVRGAKGELWFHFHSSHLRTKNPKVMGVTPGFLVKVFGRGKAVKNGDILVEPGNMELPDRITGLEGFVPLADDVMPSSDARKVLERMIRDYVREQMAEIDLKRSLSLLHRYGVILGAKDSGSLHLAQAVTRGEETLRQIVEVKDVDRLGRMLQQYRLNIDDRLETTPVLFELVDGPSAAGLEENVGGLFRAGLEEWEKRITAERNLSVQP